MQRLHLVYGLLFILTAISAKAERYMLTYKNEQSFSQVHSRWVLSPATSNRILSLDHKNTEALVVQESLSQVQAVIVDAKDVKSLQGLSALGGDVVIEKEIFYPAPRPVLGFEPTKAWSFDANYAVQNHHEILARKKRRSKPPQAKTPVEQDAELSGPRTPWGILNVKAMEAWELSNQGEGARVVVLDTGIDINHPALKNQIEETKDFVENGNSVEDKVGHGTHVAGTVAAALGADGFTGVAPKAKVLAGRVCSEAGCSSFAVVSGINWAIEKKADIINLSLGSDFGSFAEKSAVEKAEKAGVTVIAASGNDGKPSVGFPAGYPSVLAVGAIDVKNAKADFSQWGKELDIVAPGVEVISAVPMGTGCEPVVSVVQAQNQNLNASCFTGSAYLSAPVTKELVFVGLGKPEDFTDKNLTDKFALIERGEILFSEKVQNALAANAAGVVIFNNKPGLMSGSISEDGSVLAIPIVMIEQTAGSEVRKALDAGKKVEIAIATAPSDYSAYSGTSMASPHVAGVAALVKAANKNLTPAQIREVLMTSTTLIKDDAGNAANWYGTGAVNAENAVTKALQVK